MLVQPGFGDVQERYRSERAQATTCIHYRWREKQHLTKEPGVKKVIHQ